MKYLEWNHIIGQYFFNPSKAGKETLLYITQQEISELGIRFLGFTSLQESWEDYCKSLRYGFPEISNKSSFIERVGIVYEKWLQYEKLIFEQKNNNNFNIEGIFVKNTSNNIAYPFYLGFLSALIIPLTDSSTELRADAYYKPLNKFLKDNSISVIEVNSDKFSSIPDVWNNLEKWSKKYYETDIGFFERRNFGNRVHLSKLFSQCILTPRNIRDIPSLFWVAGLAPNSFISESHVRRIIRQYGQKEIGLSKKVVDIINEKEDDLSKVIIDIVKREYVNWKGYVIEYDEDETVVIPKSGWIYGTLFSAFNLNREDETFNHFYYLHSQNDFPDELNIGEYEITNSGGGYSRPIPVAFNQNLNLVDEQNKWRASATQNETILYSSGSYFGLPASNLIETDKISLQSTMYLLCADSKKEVIESWGNSFIQGDFVPINYDNIPPGFNLYKFKNPQKSHPTEELLEVPSQKRVELRGGIKVGNREYLKNLLPKIYVHGANGAEKIFLEYQDVDNRIYLSKNPLIPEEFIIPSNVVCNQIFVIKGENEKLENSELTYQIIDIDFNPLDIINENSTKRNRFGEISNIEDKNFVIGSNATYSDWQRQLSCIHPFFSSVYNSIEFILNEKEYKLDNGNFILQILSYLRNLKLQEFSEILDSIESNSRIWELSSFQQNSRYVKQTSISFYDYLGFLDYDYSLNKISINKPQFVVIPSHSSFKAILIGGRSKAFVDELQNCCNKHQVNIDIIPQASQLDIYYLPDLIKLIPANCKNSTEAWKKLQNIATELNIEFRITDKPYSQPQIVQFGLQDFSETIKGYKQNMLINKFVEKPNYEWARKVFDTNSLKFIRDVNPIDKNLSLQEYYVQYQYSYILWLDNKSYEVDRNWGKFLLLSEKNKKVIFYNEETQELAIPKYIQLPRLIAESIMLLSGQVPYYKGINIGGNSLVYQFYLNVPKLFAENLFVKFNQQIQIKNDL